VAQLPAKQPLGRPALAAPGRLVDVIAGFSPSELVDNPLP
jgi:hypothetical protein